MVNNSLCLLTPSNNDLVNKGMLMTHNDLDLLDTIDELLHLLVGVTQ